MAFKEPSRVLGDLTQSVPRENPDLLITVLLGHAQDGNGGFVIQTLRRQDGITAHFDFRAAEDAR